MSLRAAAPAVAGLLLTLALGVLPAAAAAELRAALEPRVVDELEATRLTIRATGSNRSRRLELDALEEDFEVLTTQSSSQYRSVNGQVEAWVEYQIMLRPRRAGDLVIPPIRIGDEATPELSLRVRPMEPELRRTIDRMVFFETEVTVDPVYVQAQTVLVRRLYYTSGAQIYSDLPGLPEIADAVVVPLGDATSSTTILDGQRYGVIEQRFAIFPERSGRLTIPAISITSSVRIDAGGRTRRSGVRVATEPITLEVLPIPAEYPADHPWLPANDVSLDERWSPADARVEVGDPLSRTVTARVEGNVSSVIPPLDPALPENHFRRYPEPPALQDQTAGGTVSGSIEQTEALIAIAPGTVDVAPAELVWWDVDRREVRTARASGRTLWISGEAPRSVDPEAAVDDAPAPAAEAPLVPEVDVRDDHVPWPGPARRQALLWTLIGIAAATLVMSWWSRRRPAPHPAATPPPSRRARWKALRTASRKGDPGEIHHALMEYLGVHYGTGAAEAARRFREEGHGALLDRLNASRYRAEPGGDLPARDVMAAARRVRRGRRRRNADPLPALYD